MTATKAAAKGCRKMRAKGVIAMRFISVMLAVLALLCSYSFAEFSMAPYLYPGENASGVAIASFASANGTAKLVKVNGVETLLVQNDLIVSDKGQISSILTKYYTDTYYPSASDMAALKGYADAFNASRNYKSRYGPVEKTCYTGGTFLSYKPCNDLSTCMQTAQLVCTITGSDGCMIDILGTDILAYKKSIDKLNDAYAKFSAAYSAFSASTAAASLGSIDDAFVAMKAGADEVMKSKLRFPETTSCSDCLGICPEAHFDYASLTSGRAKVAALEEKVAPLVLLGTTIDKLAISTQERTAYLAGEEQALVLAPKYDAAKAQYGGLKAQAVEAKALVSDANFVSVADNFIARGDELEMQLSKRNFTGFDTALSSYATSGRALAGMLNNSTSAYMKAENSEDSAGDNVLIAQWRVNRLSKTSIDSYNALAGQENKLEAQLTPPMTSAQYIALAGKFDNLSSQAKTYADASASAQESVFGFGNAFSRATVDGAMSLASSIMPVSFKTRQSFAKFVPPLVVAAVDLSILAIAVIIFAAVFYHFRHFFRSKLLISGWVLTLLGFTFLLLVGSVGFYSIVMSTEKFASFTDFMGTVQASGRVAIIVEESGASSSAITGMRACADQVAMQAKALNKASAKYYINGNSCTRFLPVNSTANSTNTAYSVTTGLSSSACLDSIPDVPVFDLQYAAENAVPAFTTVVTKQAIVKGNEAYYGEKPMCDIANVLG
ncbi:MAG: hypothetical protein NTX79_00470 [Candidatus Micrarchaeota archaeon]|nr:hypothetical protein [Candidatus Micrarchaeota archaeon]